ncbi:hypothetical protein ACVIYL_008930 [Bradyrhizobium sp. USDA 3315]
MIVAFRKHTLLPLDDCLYALQNCRQRSRISRARPCTAACNATGSAAFVAVDRTSEYAFARLVRKATGAAARAFLDELVAAVRY